MNPEQFLFAVVFVIGMFSGVAVILMAMRQRSHFQELRHQERMAMIERGMTPPSDEGPGRRFVQARAGSPPSRSMSLGIVVVAIGLGLMSIVGFAAGEPEVALGIGGAIMIVGAAFIVNSVISRQAEASLPVDSGLTPRDFPPSQPPVPPA